MPPWPSSSSCSGTPSWSPPWTSGIPVASSAPPVITESMLFPYLAGSAFVTKLLREGIWEEVNIAYDHLPVSTEQILHFDRYVAGDIPQDVSVPDVGSALGQAWSVADRGYRRRAHGHADVRRGAAGPAIGFAAGFPEEATTAAGGWDGDRYTTWTTVTKRSSSGSRPGTAGPTRSNSPTTMSAYDAGRSGVAGTTRLRHGDRWQRLVEPHRSDWGRGDLCAGPDRRARRRRPRQHPGCGLSSLSVAVCVSCGPGIRRRPSRSPGSASVDPIPGVAVALDRPSRDRHFATGVDRVLDRVIEPAALADIERIGPDHHRVTIREPGSVVEAQVSPMRQSQSDAAPSGRSRSRSRRARAPRRCCRGP